MNQTTQDVSLNGISILALGTVLPFLQAGQTIEAVIALVLGFGLQAIKYLLRD